MKVVKRKIVVASIIHSCNVSGILKELTFYICSQLIVSKTE
jgi:hypothetical protein